MLTNNRGLGNLKLALDYAKDKHNWELPVMYLAIGGYAYVYELLRSYGYRKDEIATEDDIKMTSQFLQDTHGKKVLIVNNSNALIDYRMSKSGGYFTNLNPLKAMRFEDFINTYATKQTKVFVDKEKVKYRKPYLVIFNDVNCNYQFDGYKIHNTNFGFAQFFERFKKVEEVIQALRETEPHKCQKFVKYEFVNETDEDVVDFLAKLKNSKSGVLDEEKGVYYFKPMEFRRLAGSKAIVEKILKVEELGISQFSTNKCFRSLGIAGKLFVVPVESLEWSGHEFVSEKEQYEKELAIEFEKEKREEEELQASTNEIMEQSLHIGLQHGFVKRKLAREAETTLQELVSEEMMKYFAIDETFRSASEYKEFKRARAMYFINGVFEDSLRSDENFSGGRFILTLDIDDKEYELEEIQSRLSDRGLFGVIYPTAKHYFNGEKRWRLLLMSDRELDKREYRSVIEQLGKMLRIEIDEASKKLNQLMGLPLKAEDVVIHNGHRVKSEILLQNAKYEKEQKEMRKSKVIDFPVERNGELKSLREFNHESANLLDEALKHGVPKGARNNTYRKIYLFLRDTLESDEFKEWHSEAQQLLDEVKIQAEADGIDEKERKLIFRNA
ncbi:hypothetical protein SAMN02745116_02538 [Pilibacter termitis]|uniref:Uncharacterized protein n=1 Tax=Pilibacter termitis TaxID=263852 RepID=A0A1T4RCJ6_9ENTE|nr:hypothetical protein [Pilibacter termitis]SKA13663.1 hypothetical protein SAMN02745116_02538 [Pilibacter termitis]